jgi:group I intron endonuclease
MGYCVYKHTAPNGKIYIGVTGRDPVDRFACGHGYRKNVLFWRAIKKYGWKNIKHEILYDNLEKREAYELEKSLIADYNSCDPEIGYNISIGGEGGTLGVKFSDETRGHISSGHIGLKPSDETRQKIRNSKIGAKNPNYGKKISDEQKKKISISVRAAQSSPDVKLRMSNAIKKNYEEHPERRQKLSNRMKGSNNYFYGKHFCGADSPNYGKHMTEEMKAHLSEVNGQPVICIETGIVYKSQKEAAEKTGLNYWVLNKRVNDGKPYKGQHWRKYERSI